MWKEIVVRLLVDFVIEILFYLVLFLLGGVWVIEGEDGYRVEGYIVFYL